jgi:hypothetical protein
MLTTERDYFKMPKVLAAVPKYSFSLQQVLRTWQGISIPTTRCMPVYFQY